MKAIKFLLFLIVLGFLAAVGYQNQDYFLTDTALHIDLKVSSLHYTANALPNWAYWGICFGLGLLITGMRGLFTAFRLGREIKGKNARITELNGRISTLKSELEVFTHDPYIKKASEVRENGQTTEAKDPGTTAPEETQDPN